MLIEPQVEFHIMGRIFPQMEQTRPCIPPTPRLRAYGHGLWAFKNNGDVPYLPAERERA
jgi:hypothetical protein